MHLHNKGRKVCIKARSPSASLPFEGQVTEQTTVKWSILPIRFHAVCIYGTCLNWLLPELLIPAAGQKGRRLWRREWSLTQWNANPSNSSQTAYLILEEHFKFFSQQFPWVLQLWRFFIKWYQKEWSMKLHIDNGGWHETLNLLHVNRCKMLHFVTSLSKQHN